VDPEENSCRESGKIKDNGRRRRMGIRRERKKKKRRGKICVYTPRAAFENHEDWSMRVRQEHEDESLKICVKQKDCIKKIKYKSYEE
jgi:hypothetical protein